MECKRKKINLRSKVLVIQVAKVHVCMYARYLDVEIMYESNPRVPMPSLPPPPPNSPPCGPFLWSNAPLPRDFLGVKCPAPQAEVTKPRLISGNLNKVFNIAISIIFCIPVQHLHSSFFFCVHSDHLGSRCELSALGTLQSSVSRQEEVQGHESVHSKFCNLRVFSEGSLSSGFNYWQRSKSFVKCT